MFAIERQLKIKDLLQTEKHVDVAHLSQVFSVSEVTIRRDLEKLAQEGYLIKTYGGAVLNEECYSILDFSGNRESFNDGETSEDRRMIGRMAADMIISGEAVFLTPGQIGLEIAKKMRDKKATVVTNDLVIGMVLKDFTGIKTILTGGDLVQGAGILVGHFSRKVLEGIFINKAFIEVQGASLGAGYTVDSNEEMEIIQTVIKRSTETIMVADHSKFGRTAFARLGDLSMARKVITNKQVSFDYKEFFFEHGIKLFTTYEFE